MPDWISVTEAVKEFGYSRKQIFRLIEAGLLKAQKIVTVWQVERASLAAYVRRMEKQGAKRGPKPKD